MLGGVAGGVACGGTDRSGDRAGDEMSVGLPIVGGAPASSEQLFATVSLVPPIAPFEPFCTGTLVAPDVVVTAAHCVVVQDGGEVFELEPSDFLVSAGALVPEEASGEQRHAVSLVTAHAFYDPISTPGGIGREDDIAVVVLAEPVGSQDPAPILPLDEFDVLVQTGTPIVITGYGHRDAAATDLEQTGELYIAETPFQVRSTHEYIAGNPDSPDSCLGDSGGPGYVAIGEQLALVGASSRAAEPSVNPCGKGGLNTLVSAYEAWLAEQTDGRYQSLPIEGDGGAGRGGEGPSDGRADAADGGDCSVAAPRPRVSTAPTALSLLAMALGVGWAARRRPRRPPGPASGVRPPARSDS